jgi:acetyl-CoA carboxylase biotin carboxyl carrier protein
MTPVRLATIKDILDAFARSGAEELEVTDGTLWLRILMRRRAAASPAIAAASMVAEAAAVPAETPLSAAAPAGDGIVVTAAMHGVFHRAAAPGAEPFVSAGRRVVRGQQLCILEAMKVFTTVAAPQDGVVATIHVENGEDVRAGQPLFTLAPVLQLRAAE